MCYLGFPGTISASAETPASIPTMGDPARFGDLVLLRRVRDRIDRDVHLPLDVEALARGVGLAPRQLSRQFEVAYGRSLYGYLVTRRAEQGSSPSIPSSTQERKNRSWHAEPTRTRPLSTLPTVTV
jgi:hypothetical protein